MHRRVILASSTALAALAALAVLAVLPLARGAVAPA